MLQKESVDKAVLDLILSLMGKDYLQDFMLVGGTGLALIIGHRKSMDIDLFASKDFDEVSLLEKLETDFNFQLDFLEGNTIKGNVEGAKVDFIAHKYPTIGRTIEEDGIRIQSVDDISAMKVNSVANDGTRAKDFIDLYFLLADHKYDVERLLSNYKAKYSQRNALHALKSLNYFEDVEVSDWPELIKNKETNWDEIREFLDKACELYIRKIS